MKRGRGFTLARLGWGVNFFWLGFFGTLSLRNHEIETLSRGIDISVFLIIGGDILVGVGNYARQ
jgi:hypothetical protein